MSIFIYVVIGGLLLLMVICAIIQSIQDGPALPPSKTSKEAKSVVKGGIVGGIIGGVPGAVVGALAQKSKIDTENTKAVIDAINKKRIINKEYKNERTYNMLYRCGSYFFSAGDKPFKRIPLC